MAYKEAVINDHVVAHLKACSAQGLTLSKACKELHVSVADLRAKAKDKGLLHIIERYFPSKASGMTTVPYDPIIFQEVLTERKQNDALMALTVPWRLNDQGR